jgi:hypothetical protein
MGAAGVARAQSSLIGPRPQRARRAAPPPRAQGAAQTPSMAQERPLRRLEELRCGRGAAQRARRAPGAAAPPLPTP